MTVVVKDNRIRVVLSMLIVKIVEQIHKGKDRVRDVFDTIENKLYHKTFSLPVFL